MPPTFKICAIGSEGVGKTSLIRRFAQGSFEIEYLRTLGVAISKKRAGLDHSSADEGATLVIWDIMGDFRFFSEVADGYLHGANGILAVLDLTRPETLDGLFDWWELGRRKLPKAVGVIAANKADLVERVPLEELEHPSRRLGWPYVVTSARDGTGVEESFRSLVDQLSQKH